MAIETPILLPFGRYTTRLNWLQPVIDNAVGSVTGSVLIYRAPSRDGTYSVWKTISSKDANGSQLTTYPDETIGSDYYYRIRFYDGLGSSEPSNIVTKDYWELLANFEPVKRLAQISPNSDIGSVEIFEAIENATFDIYTDYGRPTIVREMRLETGSYEYNFTGDRAPIYKVDRVEVGTSDYEVVPVGSYTIDYVRGYITLGSVYLDANIGHFMQVEYVPQLVNQLAEVMSALNILESSTILSGEDTRNTLIEKLQRRRDKYVESLKPKGCYGSSKYSDATPVGAGAEGFVPQEFQTFF